MSSDLTLNHTSPYKALFNSFIDYWQPRTSIKGMYHDLMIILISQNLAAAKSIQIRKSLYNIFKCSVITFEMINGDDKKLLMSGLCMEKITMMRRVPKFFTPSQLLNIPEISMWTYKRFMIYAFGGIYTDIVFYEDRALLHNLSIIFKARLTEDNVKTIFKELFYNCETIASIFFHSLKYSGAVKLRDCSSKLIKEDFISRC